MGVHTKSEIYTDRTIFGRLKLISFLYYSRQLTYILVASKLLIPISNHFRRGAKVLSKRIQVNLTMYQSLFHMQVT